jgi:hypothetical protein
VFVKIFEGNKKDCEGKEANDFDSRTDYSFIRRGKKDLKGYRERNLQQEDLRMCYNFESRWLPEATAFHSLLSCHPMSTS